MGNNIYIGNRYVPVFANPVEWDNLREYEPLTIVTYNGTAYTSKTTVPVGTALTDTNYWVVTGNYNAQVEEYRQAVVAVDNRVDGVETELGNVSGVANNALSVANTAKTASDTNATNISALQELIKKYNVMAGSNTYPEGTTFHLIAGVMRQDSTDGTKWNYLDDAGHKPIGVSGAYATASDNHITITHDQNYDRVVSFVASGDEYFAGKLGMVIGGSVGTETTVLDCMVNHTISGVVYYDGSKWVCKNFDNSTYNRSAVLGSDGVLTINHEKIFTPAILYNYCPYNSGIDITGLYTPLINNYGNRDDHSAMRFMSPTGDVVTKATPNTGMSACYTIGGARKAILDGTRGIWTAGNIWFMGIMAKFPE